MSANTITLSIDNLDGDRAAMRYQYPGQCQFQPAFISMTESGRVEADWSGEIGNSMPAHVWAGRTLRWSVQPEVDCDALAAWLRGPGLELLERVHAGHSVDWDGSNHRGTLDDDAQDASDAIERALEQLPTVEVWDMGDWLWTANSLQSVWPESKSLADAVTELQDEIDGYDGIVKGDVREALLERAKDDFDMPTRSRTLRPVHLAALVEVGSITQKQADEYAAEWPQD